MYVRLSGMTGIALLTVSMGWGAMTFKLDGEYLTFSSRKTSITNFLNGFVQAGVKVQVDPSLQFNLGGTVIHQPVEKVLEELIEPYSYLVLWDQMKTPLGDWLKLSEIRIFKPGEAWKVQAYQPEDGNFRVARGALPDSPEFVADELLLTLNDLANIDAFRTLLQQIGGSVIDSLPELGIYRIRLPAGTNVPALIEQLKNYPIVSRIEPNYIARISDPAVDGAGAASFQSPNIREGMAPVAVLDSGLISGSGIDDAVVSRYDAVVPGRALTDEAGHGTQMAMIASGAVDPDGAESLVGDGAPIVAIRTFDDNGITSSFTLMRAIQHAYNEGARVVNLSWGSNTDSDFIRSALAQAERKGMVVVASAGNEPTGKPVYPSAYPTVISVGALDGQGDRWSDSNFGDFVMIDAPGMATFPVGHNGPPGRYAGTSISSAYVARNIANYLTENPRATPSQVRNAVQKTFSTQKFTGEKLRTWVGEN
ncbi:MAG: S8 family serine peptidase [Verrucomicrobia bacterium]|nr:S8 family serine peptidase [Kiritimatiellia bacterium]MCB1102062.1 S8 family serine peptidase [Kiritimatiellia bacterium]MCP5488242.1 S8 family serine peptidase [Verrucomicrobiota bacterium]